MKSSNAQGGAAGAAGSEGSGGSGGSAASSGTAVQIATTVTSCGTLDAAQAAQLATSRFEQLGTIGLASLTGLENSRAAGRLLSLGDGTAIDLFVADSQTSLHDSLVILRDEHLIAANVESTTESSVTFLLDPNKLCEEEEVSVGIGTGGATDTTTYTIDAECVKNYTDHPARVRISRIACDQGDNVAVEYLSGATGQRMALAELYSARAELEVDLGVYLPLLTNTTTSSSSVGSGGTYSYTEVVTSEPVVSSAVGVLSASLTFTGTNQASGKLSVTKAVDVTVVDEPASRIQLAAGTDIATITADGTAKTIQVGANVGAFDWRAEFADFVNGFFGLTTTSTTEAPVALHVPGLSGSLSLDGNTDVIVAEGLDLGGAATAIQGARTLLSVTATNAASGPNAVTLTGNVDDNVGLAFTDGLAVNIQYGLEPVLAVLESPANFLGNDTLTVSATAGSAVTLFQDADGNLSLTSGQLGTLLRVDSGSLTFSSSGWPSDTVTVAATNCLSRADVTSTTRNDLLDDLSSGVCTL